MNWPSTIFDPHDKTGSRRELAEDCHAVRFSPGQPPPDSMFLLDEERIAVVPGPSASGEESESLAVYRLASGGAPAVATGRLFVRFPEDSRAENSRAALARAGFRIESIPAWAPNTCWLTADSGKPADALSRMHALFTLPGVVVAEPELLLPRHFKGLSGR